MSLPCFSFCYSSPSLQTSNWVATMVVMGQTQQIRTLTVRYFILAAQECFTLSNYNSCLAILSGLTNVAVSRLLLVRFSHPRLLLHLSSSGRRSYLITSLHSSPQLHLTSPQHMSVQVSSQLPALSFAWLPNAHPFCRLSKTSPQVSSRSLSRSVKP